MSKVLRVFSEKKAGMDIEAQGVLSDLRENLGIRNLQRVRVLNRYDAEKISDSEFRQAEKLVFSEPNADLLYEGTFEYAPGARVFAVEYLPGQYDQRADSAAQCIQILTQKERPEIRCARVYVLEGTITDAEFDAIRRYCINPVEAREASLDKPETLQVELNLPDRVPTLTGFTGKTDAEIAAMRREMGLAMSDADLVFCRDYFRDTEHRDPTVTEIRVIDTYWSDHCRHTTFLTRLNNIRFMGEDTAEIERAYREYLDLRKTVYGDRDKDLTLMDIACIGAKYLRKTGRLDDLDVSEEINACSIRVRAEIDGKDEDYLVMFKNETHNHPTEIEPFGGAATCLGGAIRDPLSGRSYVYQAMRVTGSADPNVPVSGTIKGKLPQRKITKGAANGYSSYGNQIGLATGEVTELYHPGYMAKRMEIGAVIAAAPARNVVRETPSCGDVIILLGGRTGRDGIGGATGSSKEHTVDSVLVCGSEVQKGNAPTERKLQRLFRNPEVSRKIKRCNDFGAGGVCVAIGELAPALDISLDLVPKKYEGLDGTELAISESQERMAVVVRESDAARFIELAAAENLEAVAVARVTDTGRLRMIWKGNTIADIARSFLDTNGVKQDADVTVTLPERVQEEAGAAPDGDVGKRWLSVLSDLNSCSQKGLSERFDSTIGANTVFMPFGGKYQLTPFDGMVGKIPLEHGDTTTGTIMTFGFDPYLTEQNPFVGAAYAVVESLARLTAIGGRYDRARLTFQEYFERLGSDPVKWGKPFSALLGALTAQVRLGVPSIGGKDSMSGTFEQIHVPPTLVSFAVVPADVRKLISSEFKKAGGRTYLLRIPFDGTKLPDFEAIQRTYPLFTQAVSDGLIASAKAVKFGGLCQTVSEMTFGNGFGFTFSEAAASKDLFAKRYGSIVFELTEGAEKRLPEALKKDLLFLGTVTDARVIRIGETELTLEDCLKAWRGTLDKVFPEMAEKAAQYESKRKPDEILLFNRQDRSRKGASVIRPRVFIPVFPGTNCEYDSAKAFEKAGAEVKTLVFKNITAKDIEETLDVMRREIGKAQIVMIPGGFSGGDEPDGSGKFIAAAFRSPEVRDAVHELLQKRDGLMLGICNGFQALIKLGLVPYGEIRDIRENDPTLTFNTIGRHISRMVYTRVVSNQSPWLWNCEPGEIHTVPVSHGEGRFTADAATTELLLKNHQIATQYVDADGNPVQDAFWNPNGSLLCIEGITSPDGRVLGKMAHSERKGSEVGKNVPGCKDQKIFEAGVQYFK